MINVRDFVKQQEKELADFKRKQKKEHLEYLQGILDNLQEQRIKVSFFELVKNMTVGRCDVLHLKYISRVQTHLIENWVQEAYNNDYYLSIFRALYNSLGLEEKNIIDNLLFVKKNYDNYIFVQLEDFESIIEIIDPKDLYACLRDYSDFFECERTQKFLFPQQDDPVFKFLFKQREIDNF